MKNKKNLMVLVLLALFMSLGVADSKVTTDNNASNKDDPWGVQGLKETLEEADTLIARYEEAKAAADKAKAEAKKAKAAADKAKAENEAQGSMEEIMARNKAEGSMEEIMARNKEARQGVASH